MQLCSFVIPCDHSVNVKHVQLNLFNIYWGRFTKPNASEVCGLHAFTTFIVCFGHLLLSACCLRCDLHQTFGVK
ncbi:hypothetical protein GDO78_010934 [Eleutherodactylus coqui]|uniref:Uncharacterized protein n=1 Tax=Eleutherodactylus coqui TaxID=57060 RepID=A0A8J6F811_ELECQ|nr:hypothetical protein GDO78_010934 [Eleutherodactylus coqui]